MFGKARLVMIGLVVVAIAGCNASTATSTPSGGASNPAAATPADTSTPTSSPTQPPVQTAAATLATAVPTSLDPCQLVTSQEASQLAGASFGAGQESTTSGNGKICTYGAQTLNVFMVEVGQAPDVATAQAGKAEAQAAFERVATKGVTVTELPSFADGAAVLEGGAVVSGMTFSGSAIYVLKGTIFFGMSDVLVGHAAPTSPALQAQATVVLGRLP